MNEKLLTKVSSAEDTFNLLDHIGWVNSVKPRLDSHREAMSKMLVDHLLGKPLPASLTKEQVAGMIYGINYIEALISSVLREGSKALDQLKLENISIVPSYERTNEYGNNSNT